MRTIVTAMLEQQYSQTELTFWISLVVLDKFVIYQEILACFFDTQVPVVIQVLLPQHGAS